MLYMNNSWCDFYKRNLLSRPHEKTAKIESFLGVAGHDTFFLYLIKVNTTLLLF